MKKFIVIFFVFAVSYAKANCNLDVYNSALKIITNEISKDSLSRYFKENLTKEKIRISNYLMQFDASNFRLGEDFKLSNPIQYMKFDSLFSESEFSQKIKNYIYCTELFKISANSNFDFVIFFSEITDGMFFSEIRFYNKNYGLDPQDYNFAASGNFLKVLFFIDHQNNIQLYSSQYLAG